MQIPELARRSGVLEREQVVRVVLADAYQLLPPLLLAEVQRQERRSARL